MTDLKTGDIIIFSKVPNGSFARVRVAYLVHADKNTVRTTSVETGCGTFDDKRTYRFAEYRKI